jgi:lanosterol synthase
MKETADIPQTEIFSWWKLKTRQGRQTWHFQLPDEFSGISWNSSEGQALLDRIDSAFHFHKRPHPNAQDAVLRRSAYEKNNAIAKAKTPQEALRNGWQFYQNLLSEEGHFPGDYGGPHFLLPGMVIVSYITEIEIEEPFRTLMIRYMLNHQNPDGGWGLHIEGRSTMFGTCLQYVSLRLLGLNKEHPQLSKAQSWIICHGGAVQLPPWGKFYLSCLGIYEWEGNHSLFPEMWLLPRSLPLFPGNFWCHARMVYLPMSYCFGTRLKAKETQLLKQLKQEIYTTLYEQVNWQSARDSCAPTDVYHPPHPILKFLNLITHTYEQIHISFLRKKALEFIIQYIDAEDEQTQYINIGPVNKVLNMLCVWHRYGRNSEKFFRHQQRLQDYLWLSEDGMKMQGYNGSQFWDTAFAFQSLHAWKENREFAAAKASMFRFITQQQVLQEPPKYREFFRHRSTGGFPFSNKPHGWPITDCTAEGLKVMLKSHEKPADWKERCYSSAQLLLSFQNRDGGWATYENQRAPRWVEVLNPSQVFGNIMVDYSYTECSSAALQALMLFHEIFPDVEKQNIITSIKKGLKFVLNQQRSDGSWYGSWGVCFTYGTWFATEVLSLAKGKNFLPDTQLETALIRAGTFLKHKQNPDGGWGESFESCVQKKFIPSPESQVVHTAWAVLSLTKMSGFEKELENGIDFLVKKQLDCGEWRQENISGVFNHNCAISYTNYRNIFPLWALGEYVSRKQNSS